MSFKFELPLYGVIKKTKNNKNTAITFNWYCNANRFTRNKAKKRFKELIKDQVLSFDPLPKGTKVKVSYKYYAKRKGTDLDNFTMVVRKFFQDALVELDFIEEDKAHIFFKSNDEYMGIDKENPRIVAVIEELE